MPIRITAFIAWVASGIALNALLFSLGTAIGGFGPEVVATAAQRPLTVTAVIFASLFAALAAALIRLLIGRLVRPWAKAQRLWRNFSLVVLILSFGSPIQGLSGHSWTTVAILCVMHVVSAVTIFVALSWLTRPQWTFGSDWRPQPVSTPELAVVTGATSGIGEAVAKQLYDLGYTVVGVGRSHTFPSSDMRSSSRYHLIAADVSDVREALEAGRSVATFDNRTVSLVVHCAGTLKPRTQQTADGVDENFATSFLGRLALTNGLNTDEKTRFVIVGAAESGRLSKALQSPIDSNERIGVGLAAHGKAQLANDLWTARLKRLGYRAYGYGPGAVKTGIRREVPKILAKLMGVFFAPSTRPADEAAQDIVRLLLDESLPKSGFASRDGVFHHHPFIESAQNQDLLYSFAQGIIQRRGEVS